MKIAACSFLFALLICAGAARGPTATPAANNAQGEQHVSHTETWREYVDLGYGVSLRFPSDWKRNAAYKDTPYFGVENPSPEKHGYIQLLALAGTSPQLACQGMATHVVKPFGDRPTIQTMNVQGQPACLVEPSDDEGPSPSDAALVALYPVPVVMDGEPYNLLELYGDKDYILDIVKTLKFIPAGKQPPVKEDPRPAIKSDNSQWGNLRGMSRSASMTFVVRDRGCFYGRLDYVTDHALGIYVSGAGTIPVKDSELLFVSSERVFTELFPSTLLYSWRSSWHDVQQVGKGAKLKLHLKDKRTIKGKVVRADRDGVTIETGGNPVTFSKADIIRIDNLQLEPLSDAEEGIAREAPALGVLFPGIQSRKMHMAHKLSVRLYDAQLSEMNYTIFCSDR